MWKSSETSANARNFEQHIERKGKPMATIIPLTVSDAMSHCPVQLNLNPELAAELDGMAFTFANLPNAPVYREVSHLGAWLVGFWAGQLAAQNEMKEN